MKLGNKQRPGGTQEGGEDGPKVPTFVTGVQQPTDVDESLRDLRQIIGFILNGDVAYEKKDDPSSSACSESLNVDDYRTLPSKVIELRHPLKIAVLMQLRIYLVRRLLVKTQLDDSGIQAFTSIKERLELLRDDCVENAIQDWVAIIEENLRMIGSILDKKLIS